MATKPHQSSRSLDQNTSDAARDAIGNNYRELTQIDAEVTGASAVRTQTMISLPVRRPRAAVRRQLERLLGLPGPFLSIYLDVTPGKPRLTAGDRFEELVPDTASAAQIEFITAALGRHDAHADDSLFAAVVGFDGDGVMAPYPDPPASDVVEVAEVPQLTPLLAAEQSLTHHLIATVDDDQLGIIVVPRHGQPSHTLHRSSEVPLDHHAGAALIDQACRASATRLVLLAGREDAVEPIATALRPMLDVATRLEVVASADSDDRQLADTLVRLVANRAAEQTADLVKLWRFHRAHHGAVDGLLPSLDAINSGRAAMVLVHDEPTDRRQLWAGLDPKHAYLDLEHAPHRSKVGPLAPGRQADILVRASLAQAVGVHIVPSIAALNDDVGVILDDRTDADAMASLLEA